MVPSPCHPLYLSINQFYNLTSQTYILDEFFNTNHELENIIKTNSLKPKALLVINPHNPTGKILSPHNMRKIVKYCYDNQLVLISSEVLQDQSHFINFSNTLNESSEFKSFRSIVNEMPFPYNQQELFSFYSISKSPLYEGSSRTGYLHVLNLDQDVKKELYKHISMDICTSIPGQIILDLLTQIKLCQDDFFAELKTDLENSQMIIRDKFFSFIDRLNSLDENLFKYIEKPKAGYSLFIELNSELIQNLRSSNSENLKNCEIYAKCLKNSKGITVTPGTMYGDYPNHIAINLCQKYFDQPEILEKILDFNCQAKRLIFPTVNQLSFKKI